MNFLYFRRRHHTISLFDLTMCSQSGRGEGGMFILNSHCMKKSPNWLFFPDKCLR